MRKQFLAGMVISIIMLVIVFWNIDRQALWKACLSANYWYMIPSILVTLFYMWFRAFRWYFLFISIKKIRIHSLFSATMIGFMANNLLPARLGEFVRAYVIGRHENVPKTASFGTIVIERILDGLVLLSFLIMSFLTSSLLPEWIVISGYIFGCVYMLALGFLILLVAKPEQAIALLDFFLKLVSVSLAERVRGLVRSFTVGLEILRNGKRMVGVILMSFLLWIVFAFSIHYGLLAFNLQLPFTASLLVMSILGFGVTIPSSPGYVGTFHASCIVALSLFAVSQADALSFAIVFHASQFILITLIGLGYLWMDHLSLRDIQGADAVS